ncbi:MAG: chromosomal replication initiator DnaA [Alphaproteobacteria bacterium PA2]|nr:MAG: chromosomal replication initiator DnaA [Alphaproteobacteria bacterium PA2]
MRLNFRRPPAYLPDEFSVGPSNRDAVARLRAWETWHNGSLALIGPEAAGKTHLARVWAERVGAYICPEGLRTLTAHIDGPIVVEDADRADIPELLFHLLNRAAQTGQPLLLTGRTLPGTWPAQIPDLRSRLNAMQVVELSPPDDEVLTDILRSFFKSRNIRPSEDIYPYLMARMERSIAAARDLVDRLDEAADAMGRPVSRALAREVLGDDTENLDLFEG